MPTWSEAILRAASSWQAFKEGKHLFESGAATVTTRDESAYTGSVRAGGRLHRVRVAVHSPSHLEARCSCPENQRTGALCAHAIAVGLAALSSPQVGKTESPAPATPAAPAWTIQFPPNWLDALRRSRLAPTLRHAPPPATPDAADLRLTEFLKSAGVPAAKSPLPLQLTGPLLENFLESLVGHSRVSTPDGPLALIGPVPLPLQSLTLTGDIVRPVPAEKPLFGDWLLTPGALARLHPAASRLPDTIPLSAFLEQLDMFQQACLIPDDSFLQGIRFVPAPTHVRLHLDGSLQSLKATQETRYDGSLPRLAAPGIYEVRDTIGEAAAGGVLARAGFVETSPGQWLLHGEDLASNFLTQRLPTSWEISESPSIARVRSQIRTLTPKFDFTASGEDWLEFNLSFESTDGSVLSFAETQRILQAGASGKRSKTIASSDSNNVLLPLLSELEISQDNGHFIARNASAAIVAEIRNFLSNKLKTNAVDKFNEPEIPGTLLAELRPYQLHGFRWLADRLKRFHAALLADDMGLGKTLQAIAINELLHNQGTPEPAPPTLIVCPTSLLGNWVAELARFAPGRRVHLLHGTGRDAVRKNIGPGSVVLTSFATLPRDLAWHLRQEYLLVVVDEASQMRNPDTDHAKALCKLRAHHRLALSGTPLENGVRDIWSIFHFLAPGWLGDRATFREHYELPLAATPPDPAILTRLRLKTAPLILRRTKIQVAPELPSKLVIDELCDLSPQQTATYQQLVQEGRKQVEAMASSDRKAGARMTLLTALLRLRQSCCDLALLPNDCFKQMPIHQCSTKLERLMELLETALSESSKILVFSQFATQLREIEKRVSERGWSALRLDGATTNRQELVNRFQSADGPPIFLISLKAGGYGLNLTAADTVIHFDPWWNPAAEAQATDRAHRIGQTRPVTVYRLLTRNTVEEKVLRLQSRKRDLAALVDETGEADDTPALTESELLGLLG